MTVVATIGNPYAGLKVTLTAKAEFHIRAIVERRDLLKERSDRLFASISQLSETINGLRYSADSAEKMLSSLAAARAQDEKSPSERVAEKVAAERAEAAELAERRAKINAERTALDEPIVNCNAVLNALKRHLGVPSISELLPEYADA